ncbi:heavy-metal-associated domain-containing protein [Flavobacterium sp. XN-5]|uniref:heavy-metal-associated domain-containing protein n=1 Tax=Flavobacterium sp. XN-5 TaxID=2599390 RepID=UPI0011C9BA61|nr:heavy-metal-associated domain-containing protein [Flavobacterium sp. XN-5]NGY37907.1 heavy-metal-associated domain-containing protein [Flavobacterium sp. XN-5]
MSLLAENVIPGIHGKVFGTNAMKENELIEIKTRLLKLEGINDIVLNIEIFPREFTIYTNKIVSIKDIENAVKSVGFHAIPK